MAKVFEKLQASLFPNGIVGCVLPKDPSIAEELKKMFRLRKSKIEPAVSVGKPFCYKSPSGSIPFDDHTLPEGDGSFWLQPDLSTTENQWTITVKHAGAPLYGLDYYINHKQTELFNTIRELSENYVVTYKRNGSAVFSISIYKFKRNGWDFVRFQFVWNSDAAQDQILQDVRFIFNPPDICIDGEHETP